jgi:6,7-dimethyl-8-ribityllumazine synthase
MRTITGKLDAGGLRLGIAVARFNEVVTSRLLEGALDRWVRHGGAEDAVTVVWVPGSMELPVVAREMALAGEVDAVVCLGAVVRGETPHFDYVAGQAAAGIARVALDTGVPVLFGVITAETMAQAIDRAGGKSGNKGADAVVGAIETVHVLREVRSVGAGRAARPSRLGSA